MGPAIPWSSRACNSLLLASEGNVAVLAARAGLVLGQRRLERVDQHRARPPRLDHVVDIAALGRGVRIREALPVILDQLLAARIRILGDLELPPEDDVHRAFGP